MKPLPSRAHMPPPKEGGRGVGNGSKYVILPRAHMPPPAPRAFYCTKRGTSAALGAK